MLKNTDQLQKGLSFKKLDKIKKNPISPSLKIKTVAINPNITELLTYIHHS